MSPQSLVLSISAIQNNSPLDPLSHLCPISPIRFACIFSFFYLFCRWNRTYAPQNGTEDCSNWRSLPMSHLNRSHVLDSTCPCSIWPLVMPFGWDTTNCVLLCSVVNIPWLICAACVLHIYYICAIRVALSITGCQTGEQRGLSSVTARDVTVTDTAKDTDKHPKTQTQTQSQTQLKTQTQTNTKRHRHSHGHS